MDESSRIIDISFLGLSIYIFSSGSQIIFLLELPVYGISVKGPLISIFFEEYKLLQE